MARRAAPPRFDHAMLQRVRLDLALTQEAAATSLGVDVRTYRRYESGAVNHGPRGFEVRSPARRKLLRRMCVEFGVEAEAAWLVATGEAHDMLEISQRIVHPLQRARHFTGREDLLATLASWHASREREPRVVAIVAVGGAGKTATVERFLAARDGEAQRPVFGWSFYDDDRVEAMLAAALAYMAREPAAEGGRLERLLAALRDAPSRPLLVFDGLEVMQVDARRADARRALGEIESPELRRLVRALAAGLGEARLLATSRLALTDLAAWEGSALRTIALGDLDAREAVRLLRAWGVRGDDAELKNVVEGVGRHALSVAMLGSYAGALLGGGGDVRALATVPLAQTAADEPLARRLAAVLEAYAAGLAPRERDALTRLCALGNGVELATLVGLARAGGALAGALEGCDARALRAVLARLTRLGLVYARGDDRFAAHPFVRAHFAARVGVEPRALHDAARAVVASSLRDRPGATIDDPATLDRLEALLEHTLASGRCDDAWRVYEHGMGGYSQLGLRLGAMGRGARVLARFTDDGDVACFKPGLAPDLRARAAYELGLYRGALGDLDGARRCYEAHLRALGERPGTGHAAGLRALGYTLWLEGSLIESSRQLDISIRVSREGSAEFHLVRALRLLAAVEHDRGERVRAGGLLAEARALDPQPAARRALWEASMCAADGRRDAARALVDAALRASEARAWAGHVAHAQTVSGALALPDDAASARGELSRARRWVAASGEAEMALRCHELAARIALREVRYDEAIAEASAGRALAEPCGFAPMAARLAALESDAVLASGRSRAEARALAERAVAGAPPGGNAWVRVEALRSEARATDPRRAREALREALALATRLGHPDLAAIRAAR